MITMAEQLGYVELQRLKAKYVRLVHRKKIDAALNLAMVKLNQFPALVLAIDNNNLELAESLINMGWDVNESRCGDGTTPLHAAIYTRSETLVRLLIEKGAITGKKNRAGNTALARSMSYWQTGSARRLAEILFSVMRREDIIGQNDHGETLLHEMARNMSVPLAYYNFVARKGVDVNACDVYCGRSFAMEMVAHQGAEESILRILEEMMPYGLNLDLVDKFGSTLLHRAVLEGKSRVVQWLVKQKVGINRMNYNLQTASWIAARKGHEGILISLYGAGESLESQGQESYHETMKSVYEIAKQKGHSGLAERIALNVGGSKSLTGARGVMTLQQCAKNAIRRQLTLDGTSMWPKMENFKYPQRLKTFLVTFE